MNKKNAATIIRMHTICTNLAAWGEANGLPESLLSVLHDPLGSTNEEVALMGMGEDFQGPHPVAGLESITLGSSPGSRDSLVLKFRDIDEALAFINKYEPTVNRTIQYNRAEPFLTIQLTGWFGAGRVVPGQPGAYQTCFNDDERLNPMHGYQWWDGMSWGYFNFSPEMAALEKADGTRGFPPKYWRGLKENPAV